MIALILTIAMAASLVALPTANAQVIDIPTFLSLTLSPNPVGVGQDVYVGMVFSKPTPTNTGRQGDYYEDVTLEITDPDGDKTTMGPYLTSMAAGVQITFTPDKVGTYIMQAFYPGQVLTGTHPGGSDVPSGMNLNLLGSTMLPTESSVEELVVTEEAVGPIYQTPPLPTEYWTRPIYATNWAWGAIGANWFGLSGSGGYDASGNVLTDGEAPTSAHVMWTKATQFGGQPGSPIASDESTQYSSTSLLQMYFKPVTILNGILYYNKYASTGTLIGWEAIEVRTGEILWSKEAGVTGSETISYGQIVNYNNFQEFGSNAFLWSTPGGGGFFAMAPAWMGIYDAYTGTFLANVTNPISSSKLIDYDAEIQGAVNGYYVSDGKLCLYNTTALLVPAGSFGGPVFVRPSGTIDGQQERAIAWSVELPTQLNGDNISLSIAGVTADVILMREVPGAVSWQGTTMGHQYVAAYDARTGKKLWGPINQTLPKYEDTALVACRDGYYVMHNKDRNLAWGYSLETGEKLWGPVQLEGGGYSSVWRDAEIAYGKVYIWDLGGYVTAINLETGEIEWTFYRGNAAYDTPFEGYPIFGYNVHSIADGMLFLSEGIMYTPPLHPSKRLAINCTDGSLVWSISQYSSTCIGAIGDGYLISWNSFDNQIYSFGKGPTATTVTASPAVSVHNNSVLVTGTVIDTAAGTTQDEQAARFPNGVPAVSEDSMEAWMEYVYQQQNKPTNATGVKVTISVFDPNGNVYEVGTTTSDTNGFYKLAFTPSVPGEYSIFASFAGSDSYYGSNAETAINVEEAPVVTPSPTPVPQAPVETYFTLSTIAIIIAIVVVGILLFRKR